MLYPMLLQTFRPSLTADFLSVSIQSVDHWNRTNTGGGKKPPDVASICVVPVALGRSFFPSQHLRGRFEWQKFRNNNSGSIWSNRKVKLRCVRWTKAFLPTCPAILTLSFDQQRMHQGRPGRHLKQGTGTNSRVRHS